MAWRPASTSASGVVAVEELKPGADEGVADGVVRAVHYQGSVTRLNVQLAQDVLVVSVAAGAEPFHEGDNVHLTWHKASMRAMAGNV